MLTITSEYEDSRPQATSLVGEEACGEMVEEMGCREA